MNQELASRAAKFYGLKPAKIFAVQKGYRNHSFRVRTSNQDDLNLIFYKSEPGILDRIQRADQLSETAHQKGLPVRRLFDPRILTLQNPHRTIYARLYHYLPGQTIAWEMFSMNHIKLLGWAMSDLHHALQSSPIKLPTAARELTELNQQMIDYFAKPSVKKTLQNKLQLRAATENFQNFNQALTQTARQKPQPLHLDLVRGNLLYKKTPKTNSATWQINSLTLSGIIDFEKAASGAPILDLARSYAFLLVDVAHKSPNKIFKYLVNSGYQKRGQNSITLDPKPFESLTNFFLFHDFYKFLRHNPYESLHQNHHFVQTRNLLLDRKVLKLS